MRQQFTGRNGRTRRRGAVHDIELRDWFGVPVPVPACHVGTGGWDFTRLVPTPDVVTCRRCLRAGAGRAAPPPVDLPPGQLALDLDQLGP